MWNVRSSEKGFNLIELMMSTGLIGLMSLIVNSIVLTGLRGSRTIEANVAIAGVQAEIQSVLSSRQGCSGAFGSGNVQYAGDDSIGISQISRSSNGQAMNVVAAGEDILPGIKVSSLELERAADMLTGDIIPPEVDVPQAGQTSYWVQLKVEVERKGVFGPESKFLRPHTFRVTTDSVTDDIVGCHESSPSQAPSLHFLWVVDPGGGAQCPLGYTDLGITDDSDKFFNLSEQTQEGVDRQLCMSGIVGSQWVNINSSCPSGFISTGIQDNSNGIHATYENSGDECTQQLCIQGVNEVQWLAQCPLGWTASTLKDRYRTDHCMTQGAPYGTEAMELCVR